MKFCEDNGHSLTSFTISNTVDPVAKVLVSNNEILCFRCGKSLADVRAETATPKKRARSPKKTAAPAAALNPAQETV